MAFFKNNLSGNQFSGLFEGSFEIFLESFFWMYWMSFWLLATYFPPEVQKQTSTQWLNARKRQIVYQHYKRFLLPLMVPQDGYMENLTTPPPPISVRRAGKISWRYDNERKNLNFHNFMKSSSVHLEITFSWLPWPKKHHDVKNCCSIHK